MEAAPQWFESTAMADLLGADFGLADTHKLYEVFGFVVGA